MNRPVIAAMILLLLTLSMIPSVAVAQPNVCGFYGSVTLDGLSVPNGTVVKLWIDGEVEKSTDATASKYNTYVDGDYHGNTVFFTVGDADTPAIESALWEAGAIKHIDLNAVSDSATGSISGHISASDGVSPIENVMVHAYRVDETDGLSPLAPLAEELSEPAATAMASTSGYTIIGLASGQYRIYAQADGFIREYYDGAYDVNQSTLVTVNAPLNTPDIDFVLDALYTLAIIALPDAGGTVALDPPGGIYVEDSEVTLTADANEGYTFSHWSGDTPVLSIDSTLGEILEDPKGEAILRECLGDANMDNPSLSMVFHMNLRQIMPMSSGLITDEMIACVETQLEAQSVDPNSTTTIQMTQDKTIYANFTDSLTVGISAHLQGPFRPYPSGWEIPLTVKFFSPEANVLNDTPLHEATVISTAGSGMAGCSLSDITPGTYDITLDSDTSLVNVQRNVAIDRVGITVHMGTLLEGDANGNNIIDISDFGILAASFMKSEGADGYDARADFDRNGIVNSADYDLLAANFMETSPVDVSPLTIGALFSLTGPASSLGIPEMQTVQMMVDQINRTGGVNGHPLEIIIYDDETSAEKAATWATRLIEQDNVLAIIGPTTSGTSMATIDIVTAAQIPLVSSATSAAIVTPVEDRYWVFKTPPAEKEAVAEIYTHMQTNAISKVALITDTSGFGSSGRTFLLSQAADYGIEIVDDQTFDSGDVSMESQLIHIKITDAEAVICWATTDGSATVALDMKTLVMTLPLYCSHAIANQDFIDQAGDAANGVIFPAGKLLIGDQLPFSDPQQAVIAQYVADYESLYGADTVSTFGGYAYDALQFILIALETMPEGLSLSEARACIRDEVETIESYAGISGVFNLSPDNHQGMQAGSLAMVEIVAGSWTLMAP